MRAAMMKQLSLLLALVSCSVVVSRPQSSIRAEFVRAMNEATQKKEEEKNQQSLMKRMLGNARLVKNAFTLSPPNSSHQRERKLDNGNWNYGYYNYYNREDDAYQQQEQNQQQDEEAGDDAWAEYGGLNLTRYALKYLGCQNIHSWSDDMAADNDYGPLKMDRFVVFRLCPKEKCSNYNQWGCEYNYGEYTIPMEDYLATMQQYHIQQYQEYCQTCVSCMTGTGDFAQQGNDDGANNGNNRRLDQQYNGGGQYYYYNSNGQYYQQNYEDGGNANYGANYGQYKNGQYQDDYVGGDDHYNNNQAQDDFYGAGDDDYANRNAKGDDDAQYTADPYDNTNAYVNDDMYADADAETNETAYYSSRNRCMYADVCASYLDACNPDMFTDDNYMANSEAFSDYFECAEFDMGDAQAYLGPHCQSDGFTIGIGIYEDAYCSSYVGDIADMGQAAGQVFSDDYLSPYYPKQCISCSARESYSLVTDDEIENEEEEGLYEICGELYDQAAKCNRYLGEDETYIGQYQQEANEDDVCNFVASLVENNYDEWGEAVLESPEWELAKWKEINAYKQDLVARASPGQILSILGSIGLVVVLLFYIIYLRYKLTRRMPWTPGYGKSDQAAYAGRISRVGSGITMQRSLSNLEPNPTGSFA